MDSGRFGITLRSIDKYIGTYKKEMMVNHLTGEVSIRTPESDIISYNYLSRRKHFVDNLVNVAYNSSIKGEIHSIELNELMPKITNLGENLLDDVLSLPGSARKLLFAFDMDTLTYKEDQITRDLTNMGVEIVMDIENTEGFLPTITHKDIIDRINTHVFDLNEMSTKEAPIVRIHLKSLTLYKDDIQQDVNIRNILHGIYLVVG